MTDFSEYDICCPSDEPSKSLWLDKLDFERGEVSEIIKPRTPFFKLMSHYSRLLILTNLHIRPHCVCELVQKIQIKNSALSYHLSILHENDIIKSEKQGGMKYYSLTELGTKISSWIQKAPILPQYAPDL
ncbi:MAG: ArsR/SmtB family transcription factor [Candidatus Kariarchaeaceae archaeon]|jgi:ArsR family transcriptional regulator